MLPSLAFYLFASLTLLGGTLVVFARNPVHAVLFLVFTFFNVGGLFVLLGAEFIAMLLVIVYVGAVAVLFLFVVMMLNVRFESAKQNFIRYTPLAGLILTIICAEFLSVFWHIDTAQDVLPHGLLPVPEYKTNTHALGAILYTHYSFIFQIAGLILLVAMIGAITLTLRERGPIRRQTISKQISRTREEGVALVHVTSGAGIKDTESTLGKTLRSTTPRRPTR